MSVSARALYDYSARSDKELTFKRGDTLKVIEKSPDGHWWDGLCGSNRGFIPVAYVEIIELQTTPSSNELTAIPAPPTRRSSMQDRRDEMELEHTTASETPGEPVILEVPPDREATHSPEPPKVTLTVDPETEVEEKADETTTPLSPTDPESSSSQKPPITGGSVKALSGKFTQPSSSSASQQVLVHPHRKHTDLSPRKSYDPPQQPQTTLDSEGISRSASASSSTGGGRVTQLTEQLKLRNPPPTKPRPHSHTVSPGADRATASFQITPHSSTVGSPLQQAQLGSKISSKPSSSNKTTPSKTPRGAGVLRRDKSQKREDRPPLPSKPIAKPPPPKAPTELRAELQAVVGKRRPTD